MQSPQRYFAYETNTSITSKDIRKDLVNVMSRETILRQYIMMKWVPKIERNLAGRLEIRMRKYGGTLLAGAAVFGGDMSMLRRLLESEGGIKGNLFSLDDVYEHYYYVTLKVEAWLQLRLLYDDVGNQRLMTFLSEMLKKPQKEEQHLEDGWDRNDRPVYFSIS